MSSKENFNQAMFEMFGIGKDPNKKSEEGNVEVTKKDVKTAKAENKKETKAEAKAETKTEVKPVETKREYPRTVLAEGTVFEGNLTSKGDVEIGGQFKGDITTEGNVMLHSAIEGNINAKNLDVISNVLKGNVTVSGKVNLAVGSEINGNISASGIVCSGKIIGDMVIDGDASFDELSYVVGNITAKYITINHGAYIDGKITIKK